MAWLCVALASPTAIGPYGDYHVGYLRVAFSYMNLITETWCATWDPEVVTSLLNDLDIQAHMTGPCLGQVQFQKSVSLKQIAAARDTLCAGQADDGMMHERPTKHADGAVHPANLQCFVILQKISEINLLGMH